MRRQKVRVEMRHDGTVASKITTLLSLKSKRRRSLSFSHPSPQRTGAGKAHNAGGKSKWMSSFYDKPGRTLRTAIGIFNATS